MPFGEFDLVAVRIPDPGAQAHTIGPLLERADEQNSFFFQNRAKLSKVAHVDTNVIVCQPYLSGSVLAGAFDQFEERRARLVTVPD